MKIQLEQKNMPLTIFSYSSLTDIVLLLLVFFLLTSSFIITEGLQVTLPEAENTNPAEQKQVIVSLLNDGRIFINNSEIGTESDAITIALKEALTDPEEQTVVLSSDRDVPLETAVMVMDEAKGVGATRFFISTVPRTNDDSSQ